MYIVNITRPIKKMRVKKSATHQKKRFTIFETKLIGKIPESLNAKEHYQ